MGYRKFISFLKSGDFTDIIDEDMIEEISNEDLIEDKKVITDIDGLSNMQAKELVYKCEIVTIEELSNADSEVVSTSLGEDVDVVEDWIAEASDMS